MYHLPPRKRRLYKRSVASSRRRGLPPTEYWQRQRISMRRRYYSTFCRIWQDKRAAPKGGGILPSPRPVIARRGKAPTWQSVPRPLSQLRCQLPHRGSQDQAREPQRPLPPPSGEVPPQGAERARIPRPVIARRAATRQSVLRPIFFKFSPNFFIFGIDKFPLFIYNKHQETRRRYSAPPLV